MPKLTLETVKRARYRGGKDIRWDDQMPGFGLRITAAGSKSYVLRYRTRGGRQRLYSIGRVGVLTLADARERAQRALVAIMDGRDPVAERGVERARITVPEFFDHYIDRHSKPTKRSWKEDRRRLARVAEDLGAIALGDLTTADLAGWHSRVGKKTPIEANRTIQLVTAALNKAREWGHVPETYPNPARRVKRFPERSRERFLTGEELPRVFSAVQDEENVYIRGVFYLILLTGLRRGEALGLQWVDVDLDNRLLRIERTKAGGGRTVPLTEEGARLLASLPREAKNPFVFPGRYQGTPLNAGTAADAWKRIRAAAGVPDATIHDLRRSVGSHLAMRGAGLPIVGAILGHASTTATAIYARLQPDSGRVALEGYSEMLTRLAGGPEVWECRIGPS